LVVEVVVVVVVAVVAAAVAVVVTVMVGGGGWWCWGGRAVWYLQSQCRTSQCQVRTGAPGMGAGLDGDSEGEGEAETEGGALTLGDAEPESDVEGVGVVDRSVHDAASAVLVEPGGHGTARLEDDPSGQENLPRGAQVGGERGTHP
jgi:hypothetical protein